MLTTSACGGERSPSLKISVGELHKSGKSAWPVGAVWFTIGGVDFPAARWHDLPVSVLGSMGNAIGRVHDGEIGEFYFFEGSFFLHLIPGGTVEGVRILEVLAARDDGGLGGQDGVIEARCHATIDEVKDVYLAGVGLILEWARSEADQNLVDVLSEMLTFPWGAQ